jgi:hypothetical protein
MFSKFSSLCIFSHLSPECIRLIFIILPYPKLSNPSQFQRLTNIWFALEIMTLLLMKFSPSSPTRSLWGSNFPLRTTS